MCLVLFVMVRLAGANAFGSNRLQRYAYFSEWQYVDPKKILFVALTLVKQSPLPLLGILPWSYLQSLSLSQVHRQAHQKQYHDDILLLFHPSLHRYGSNQSLHPKQYISYLEIGSHTRAAIVKSSPLTFLTIWVAYILEMPQLLIMSIGVV